jgi:hypothetical protein
MRFSYRSLTTLLAALLSVLLASADLQAVQPSVGAISPYGVQRGKETIVTFSGARLGEAERLLFYSPGLTTQAIEKVNDNTIKATIAVAEDCRLGIHALRIQTTMGVSNLRTFTVGALPEVPEVEPNSEFATPQAIELNTTVSGIVQNEDVDYFLVKAKKGQRIVAELEGIRLGNDTLFDPYVAILDAKRFELSRSDDAALLRQDCLCAVTAPEDGDYIVQIRESAYGGNGNCKYRLHVGTFPRPTAVLPAGGRPGETLEVKWVGDPAGDWVEKVTLPASEDLEFGLFARDDHGIAPSPNLIRVTDLQNTIESEPNDTREEASAGVAPGAMNGILEKPGDQDYFKFSATKGQQFDVRVYARQTLRSPLDSVLTIQNARGGNIAQNDDSGGPDSYLRFNCPEDGDYFIMVRDHLGNGGANFAYRVELAPIVASTTVSVPEKQQYVSTTITVNRGNRVATMINVSRANWGGDLDLIAEGLPAGITMQAKRVTAGESGIPVVFHAAADAATDGALVNLFAKPVAENQQQIPSRFLQRQMLVRGQNNRDVWGHDADRLAVALAADSPFQVEVVQPKVPIVRNGNMELKVVAKRAEGYKAPISVVLLYNPPGIGSSGSVAIPEGATEAVIPITANSGAAIGKWPLIVRALGAHAGGTVETASQIAELEVSDSFFNFAFQKAAGEIGAEAAVVVNVENKIEFDEVCKVQLLGLPANTSTGEMPLELRKDTGELIFPIKIAPEAKPNTYKSLVCQAIIERNGERITHTLGGGELRLDVPPPPKVAAPAKPAANKPAPAVAQAPAQAPPKKPLSRLEQLRLKKAEEAGAGGQ